MKLTREAIIQQVPSPSFLELTDAAEEYLLPPIVPCVAMELVHIQRGRKPHLED
jgi:hypothetical protein